MYLIFFRVKNKVYSWCLRFKLGVSGARGDSIRKDKFLLEL